MLRTFTLSLLSDSFECAIIRCLNKATIVYIQVFLPVRDIIGNQTSFLTWHARLFLWKSLPHSNYFTLNHFIIYRTVFAYYCFTSASNNFGVDLIVLNSKSLFCARAFGCCHNKIFIIPRIAIPVALTHFIFFIFELQCMVSFSSLIWNCILS